MRLCPQCGTQNPPDAQKCEHCGRGLARFDQTVVGFALPTPAPENPPAAAPSTQRFRGTMIGVGAPNAPVSGVPASAAPFPSAPPPPRSAAQGAAAPNTRASNQTMIGMAAPAPNGALAGHPSAQASAASPAKYPTPPPPPTPTAAAQRAPVTQQQIAPSGSQPLLPSSQTLPSSQKTILGVARPGIAPLNPGQAKPAARAPEPAPISNLAREGHVPSSPRPVVAAPRNGAPRLEPEAPRRQPALQSAAGKREPKRRIPIVAAMAMVAAAGLFAAALVVWLFYHGHGPVEARATALADGSEKLELTCAACEDGTVARLDAANATFSATHATLPLLRPLKVGDNPMTITLVTPRGKQSFVEVAVPLAFQVRGDTSGLDAPTPELRVLVDALPGSVVTVDGKPLALNAAGEGTYAIDVSALVTGFEPSVKTLERRVPYTVTPPQGRTADGSVTLQAGITPLVVDAPGASVVLEGSNFVLAGRTSKAGALTVGDRPITVDGAGRFAQMMNVSAPGETTILLRASSKDSSPRLFPLHVRRVDSLVKEAERLRPLSTNSYATIADQTGAKRGWAVALDGSVVDARTENYNTVIVMDVQSGCARGPCLARITYGAPFTLARGDKFSAFGNVEGVVDGPRSGTKIPEIRADFLLKTSK